MLKRNSLATKFISLFLVLSSLCLCACSQSFDKQTENGEVTFTDALGRQVSVPKNVERVAALIGSFADLWMLAGGEIVASASDAWEDFGLELEVAQNLGGAHSPSLEILLSCDPDFVIASASTASNVQMKEILEGAGITVAYFDVDNFDDYLEMLDICTDITGRKDLYEKNGLSVKREIENIKNEISSHGIQDSERTVLLLRASSGAVKAKGSQGTILGEMLAELGLVNIADSDVTLLENLSAESVISQDPYRIFVVTMGSDSNKAIKSLETMIAQTPAWKDLEAIKQNRLYVMDKKLFNIKPNANH